MKQPRKGSSADPAGAIDKSIRLLVHLTVSGRQPAAADFAALASETVRQLLQAAPPAGAAGLRLSVDGVDEDTGISEDEADLPHA